MRQDPAKPIWTKYFLICQTCFCEFLSLELFMRHQSTVHLAKHPPDLQHRTKEHGARKLPQRQQSIGVSFKDKIRLVGSTDAVPSRPKATQSTSINPSTAASLKPSSVSEKEDKIWTGKYKCDNCLVKFSTLVDFDSHRETCPKGRRLQCDYCETTFMSTKGLRIHTHNFHKSSLPFICSVCPKGFNRRYELTLHQRLHDKNKSVGCNFCELKFLSAYEKENHVKLRHPFASYQCKYCLYENKNKAALRRHQAMAHRPH